MIALFISLVFILSGLDGFYFEEINSIQLSPHTIINKINYGININKTFVLSFFIQIMFIALLILFLNFIGQVNKPKFNTNGTDIIIILQLLITKDLIYLIYLFFGIGKINKIIDSIDKTRIHIVSYSDFFQLVSIYKQQLLL